MPINNLIYRNRDLKIKSNSVFETDLSDFDFDTDPHDNYINFSPGETVGLVATSLCQFSQEIITFPLYSMYISSQLTNSAYPNHIYPWTVVQSLYYNYMTGGTSELWMGFPSYTILSGSLVVGDTLLCSLSQKYISSRFFRTPIVFFGRCLSNFVIAPFFTSMIMDCIMSSSVTGARNPFFFIVEGCKLIFSKPNRYRNISFAYLTSRSLNLTDRCVTYSLQIFCRCLLSNLILQIYSQIQSRNKKVNLKKDSTSEDETTLSKYMDKMDATLYTNILTDILMMPIMSSSVRCLLQGLDILIDVVGKQTSNQFLENEPMSFLSSMMNGFGTSVVPINQTYFKDIFDCLTSTYEESGIFKGFCKGLGAFIVGSIVKYLIVKIFKKSLNLYNDRFLTIKEEGPSINYSNSTQY